jgi:hypothetical protein
VTALLRRLLDWICEPEPVRAREFAHECWTDCTGAVHYARLGEPRDVPL